MIRKATIKDFDAVERMLHDFHASKASQFDECLYERSFFRNAYRNLIAAPDKGLVAVIEADGKAVGCFVAVAGSSPFAPVKVAEEIMWWVDPEHRGAESLGMLDVYESWAVDIGAKIVGLSFFGKKVPAEYKKRGFEPVEQKFAKVV